MLIRRRGRREAGDMIEPANLDEQLPPPLKHRPDIVEQHPPLPSTLPRFDAEDITKRNLTAALALGATGIPVFPVRLKWNRRRAKWEKPPAIDGWQEASTTDPEQIRAWWRDLPAALGIPAHHLVPGIWCGHPHLKLIVIDADRHGGPDGAAAFEALVEQNWLPFGPTTKTPSDGVHYFFRQPAGQTFGDTKGSLPDGIDVRGERLRCRPRQRPPRWCRLEGSAVAGSDEDDPGVAQLARGHHSHTQGEASQGGKASTEAETIARHHAYAQGIARDLREVGRNRAPGELRRACSG